MLSLAKGVSELLVVVLHFSATAKLLTVLLVCFLALRAALSMVIDDSCSTAIRVKIGLTVHMSESFFNQLNFLNYNNSWGLQMLPHVKIREGFKNRFNFNP